jgi:putative acetyltransferase
MHIRKATTNDIDELRDLYFHTITAINKKDYNEEQIKAWASTANRTGSLLRKINEQYFFVAENDDEKITGFASLDKAGYFDLLYVHSDFQRKGIAQQLLQKILDTATELHLATIATDASITAKPFFEKNGFEIIQKQTVKINGVELENYKMHRII